MGPSFVRRVVISGCLVLGLLAGHALAQGTAPEPAHGASAPTTPVPQAAPRPAAAYPTTRSTDPAAVERGRALYNATFACAGCHATDIRGTDKGNSLLRSIAMMQDANGELIATATQSTAAHGGRFTAINATQFSDIAQFLKSFWNIGTGSVELIKPTVFQSGDPAAGQRYFAANCASCHSVIAGRKSAAVNLAGIGANVQPNGMAARDLQQRWLSPTTKQSTKAVVTMANGQKITGSVTKLNEFALTMTLADGATRTIDRDGDTPKIDLTYPLAAHAALVRKISDREINDVTGYLVTLK